MGADLNFINIHASDKLIAMDTEVSMTYSNTMSVLAPLGYQLDGDGCLFDLPVEELAKACDLFLASELPTLVDNGTLPEVEQGEAGATIIHCGRREGYIVEKVKLIKIACEEARSKGATHAYIC